VSARVRSLCGHRWPGMRPAWRESRPPRSATATLPRCDDASERQMVREYQTSLLQRHRDAGYAYHGGETPVTVA
jgi:hypothetical protein